MGSLLCSAALILAEDYVPAKPGLELPVEVFEILGASRVRSRLHAASALGLTHFVGRNAQLAQFRRP
jgi:hypothetical protein